MQTLLVSYSGLPIKVLDFPVHIGLKIRLGWKFYEVIDVVLDLDSDNPVFVAVIKDYRLYDKDWRLKKQN
jgi:hypothetical protein